MPDRWTLHLGDCLSWLATLPAQSADLVVTDPPYGISRPGVEHRGRPGGGARRLDFFANDTHGSMLPIVVAAVRETLRILTPIGSCYWWCGMRQVSHIADVLADAGMETRLMGWRKLYPTPAAPGAGWASGLEVCCYGYWPGRYFRQSRNTLHNCFEADAFRGGNPDKVDHPTQKPVRVLRPLIEASCPPGGLVLDPFAGSGSVGVAALEAERRYLGAEIHPPFHAIAERRLRAAAAQLPMFAPVG